MFVTVLIAAAGGTALGRYGPGAAPGTPTPTPLPTATPTATPTPTPPPPPDILTKCHEPRAEPPEFTMFPAAPDSLFRNCQVVAFYGYPGNTVLGILGEIGSPETMAEQLAGVVAQYDNVNGSRHAIGAFHLIAAVAQASPGPDGTYLYRMPAATVEEYIRLAEKHDFIVFLDLQIGHSTVADEVEHVRPYLANPRVHLALDPEWTMPPGVAPGEQIGTMDAGQINAAQAVLDDVARVTGLRSRILVVHQFTEAMITNKATLQSYPNVDLVIDMDGFGGREIKLQHYAWYVARDGAPHGGIKLFYDEDIDIFQPAEVQEIVPQPDYIQYQ